MEPSAPSLKAEVARRRGGTGAWPPGHGCRVWQALGECQSLRLRVGRSPTRLGLVWRSGAENGSPAGVGGAARSLARPRRCFPGRRRYEQTAGVQKVKDLVPRQPEQHPEPGRASSRLAGARMPGSPAGGARAGGCWPPEGPAALGRRSLRRGRRERSGAGLTADAERQAEPPPPAAAARLAGSAGRGGKAAGRGDDLWAFQASRCLLRPPIVSPASQWGRGSRRAGPRRGPSPARARWYPAPRAGGPCAVGASVRASAARLALGARPVRPGGGVCAGARPACRARRDPARRRCALGRGARSSCAVGHPARLAGTARAAASRAHTGAHSSRLRATIWQIRVDTAAPAHSGAECPATGNNHNSVRVYYGCERARKKKSFNSKR